ncbi:MAG TPA: PP2C family protein-serine/threonine phosphatase [Solirubrobacteraceae bacterium]|nr:PP2C family protein-serine/threonine phosphatase [Solirubrobacteraceae bacterium]
MKGEAALARSFELARSDDPASVREARAAVAIAAGLYLVGALLTATALLLPDVGFPAGIIGVAAGALLTAALLLYAARHGWGGLGLACVADLWGIVLIAVLCVSGGGAGSPFALIYLFAIGHAAAFQPRGRFLLVCVAGLVAFLLPLLYESPVSPMFGAVACVGIVLALLTSAVVHSALERMREQRRRLEVLISATSELNESLDPSETVRAIARMAVPELATLCVIDLLDDSGAVGSTVAAGADPAIAAGVEGAAGARERDLAAAGYACAVSLPMVARGRTHGVISFWQLERDSDPNGGLLPVLEDLTARAAMALDNSRLYAERARVARTLRRSLMPAVLPVIPGLELASYFRPMGAGEEVGGDFYDAFGDRDGCWLIVGDVCGKGAEAAALTGFLRHTTAAYARQETCPARVLTQVNTAMLDQDFDGRFATAILARIRFDHGRVELKLAVAGHPGALITRADGTVAELAGSGKLLGILADPAIEPVATTLAPGDSLALYTDGLSEAHAPRHIVTVEDMIGRLERAPAASAQSSIDSLLGLIDRDRRIGDDIAILSARIVASSTPMPASQRDAGLMPRSALSQV